MLEAIGEETEVAGDFLEAEAPTSDFSLFGDKEIEMFISPEQFVDFWISAIFLLVGTWQIISILFLLTD